MKALAVFLPLLLFFNYVSATEVTVFSQPLVDDIIVIDSIDYDSPGWMVIHNEINGEPGEIVGMKRLFPGITEKVAINLDLSLVTDTLYAMLHQDRGLVGKWEVTKDFPVVVNGSVLAPPFVLTERLISGIGEVIEINSGKIVVDEVISAGLGWLVIESEGSILGSVGLVHGRNTAVSISFEGNLPSNSSLRLYRDGGVLGEFDTKTDFPTIHKRLLLVTETSKVESSKSIAHSTENRPNYGEVWILGLILKRPICKKVQKKKQN